MAVERENKPLLGTANVLKQTKNYEKLVRDFGEPAANGLLAKAINNAVSPAHAVTDTDVGGFARVTRAMRANPVDVQATAAQGMAEADAIATDWLSKLKEQAAATL
jgi:hypothetical protein